MSHADGLGSVTELTDGTGVVVQAYLYDSYGNIIQMTGTLVNPFTYTGRELDTESGLYFYRARYYDPRIGRFINEDPIGFAGEDINLFRYIENNPINFNDPSGYMLRKEDMFRGNKVGPGSLHAGGTPGGGGRGRFTLRDIWNAIKFNFCPPKVKGGKGPVLKGQQGVEKAIAQGKASGEKVIGREITVETSGARTRIDLITKTKEGRLRFIECKNGPCSRLTPNQRDAFPRIRSEGGIPRGANAEAAGLIPGQPIGPTEVIIKRF